MIELRGIYVYQVDTLPSGAEVEQMIDNIYHIRLTVEDRTVTANVYSYTGEWQEADMEIVFDVGGVQQAVQTVAGVASVTVAASEEPVTVRTLCDTVRNAELVVMP